MRQQPLVALAATALVTAVAAASLLPTGRTAPDDTGVLIATAPYRIDTTSKTAVNRAFRTRWLPAAGAAPGWTGSVPACRKGTVSDTYVRRLATALNFVRALNRLDPVAVGRDRPSSGSAYSTQETALMMHANRTVSHHPSSSWACYSRTGAAGAARSLLSISFDGPWTAGRALGAYLADSGPANVAVGHRRWLTTPWAKTVYVGATTNTSALLPVLVATSTRRRNPAFTSWPTAGYFPTQLDPAGRWSWSSRESRADLSRARVRVWKNGRALAVRQHAVRNGYGQPTLVWQMPAESRRTGVYTVTVSGVRSAGGALRPATTYRVRAFLSWRE